MSSSGAYRRSPKPDTPGVLSVGLNRMIYISCNRRIDGSKTAVVVCDKTCGGCPDYDEFLELQNLYIELFFDERHCAVCGGTGITEIGYNCSACGKNAPWRLFRRKEKPDKKRTEG